jgi:hypothetical protein
MKRKIIGQKRQLLLLVGMGLWSSVSAAEDSTTLIKEKLKQGCEMTVSFKQEKSNCEMIVRIKEDFEDVEKGISIQMWQGCFYGYETRGGSYPRFNDIMVYRKFKKSVPEESMVYIWDRLFRRRREIDMDLKTLDYFDFTYAELFKAVEELENKDKVKLGEYTVVVKGREFKDIHRDVFFMRLILLSE